MTTLVLFIIARVVVIPIIGNNIPIKRNKEKCGVIGYD